MRHIPLMTTITILAFHLMTIGCTEEENECFRMVDELCTAACDCGSEACAYFLDGEETSAMGYFGHLDQCKENLNRNVCMSEDYDLEQVDRCGEAIANGTCETIESLNEDFNPALTMENECEVLDLN